MKRNKVSLILTVFNEEETIAKFLKSAYSQTELPDEIIITDGGSSDNTVKEISEFKLEEGHPKIRLLFKKGNRSIGRNHAIEKAENEIIAISDAGCILDKDWLREIVKSFEDNVDVVAGYYRGIPQNDFEKSLIPYVLVMEDRVNEKDFLPATRSMAIKKSAWEKAGKFNERLSHNEDYAFANKLKEIGAKIVFAKKAVVYWIPRDNFKQAFTMFSRFAYGDVESGIVRPKVVFIFARYLLALFLFLFALYFNLRIVFQILVIVFFLYWIWAIYKNFKYVKSYRAFYYLPLIQFTSDFAVLFGSSKAILKKV